MAWQSGSISPTSTSPATDISKIKNDLAQLRAVVGGATDGDIPMAPVASIIKFQNSPSSDPLALDWYEEGSITPTVIGAGSPFYTTQDGSFTRIGRVVHFSMDVQWTGGTNGASFSVGGLPYTPAAEMQSVSVMTQMDGSFTFTGTVRAYLNGSSSVQLAVDSTGASQSSLLNPSSGTKRVTVSGSYRV